MSDSLQFAESPRVAQKHTGVCLLLALLFLYNPFLAAPGASGALAVGHRPSYRATVASSELTRFEKAESGENVAIADVGLCQAFIPLQPQLRSSTQHDNADAFHPAHQFLSGNLWFRPPPAA